MATFKYIARDALGTRKEGFREAVSSNDVIGWIREQEFIPISVHEIASATSNKKPKQQSRRKIIKSSDLAATFWQLTTMVEGGIPITTALETIAEDIENLQLREIFQQAEQLASAAKKSLMENSLTDMGRYMDQNHKFLQMINVSNHDLDFLVELARDTGALGAKMTGGGLGGDMVA